MHSEKCEVCGRFGAKPEKVKDPIVLSIPEYTLYLCPRCSDDFRRQYAAGADEREKTRKHLYGIKDDTVIWLICPTCRDNPNACDSRPFKVTRAELVTADGFILCEYCGARCIEIDTPKGK